MKNKNYGIGVNIGDQIIAARMERSAWYRDNLGKMNQSGRNGQGVVYRNVAARLHRIAQHRAQEAV